MVILLSVDAYHFNAGALWRKNGDEWECYQAAPIISWMVGKSAPFVSAYLAKRGWRYEWLPIQGKMNAP